MSKAGVLVGAVGVAVVAAGCNLQEVRNKWKFGSEWQHKGSDSTDQMRYSEETGLDFKWDNSWTTGVSYRRRDVDEGSGDGENGVWVDFSYPLWKAPKKEASAAHVMELERRIAELEARLAEQGGERVANRTNGSVNGGTQ
jgi:hypothetical protein